MVIITIHRGCAYGMQCPAFIGPAADDSPTPMLLSSCVAVCLTPLPTQVRRRRQKTTSHALPFIWRQWKATVIVPIPWSFTSQRLGIPASRGSAWGIM